MDLPRAIVLVAGMIGIGAPDAQCNPVDRFAVPVTVSPEGAAELKVIYEFVAQSAAHPPQSAPSSVADWDQRNAAMNALVGPMATNVANSLGIRRTEDTIAGVPVLRVRSTAVKNGHTLIYLHGGAYVFFSSRTSLTVPSLLAAMSGDEVISVDYTLAPRGTWRSVTNQVLTVWRSVLADGQDPASIGLLGDSAGGGLAAASVLKMRDQGLPLPGALYLLSPWSDITATGDSYTTLAAADPTLTSEILAEGANAYAEPKDQKNPYVSPVYGDYSRAFPPTLIQVGTREIFLSNAVRLYQAIRAGGHEAVLDVYEGMPHVFQALAPSAPETKTSIKRATDFFNAHLAPVRRERSGAK